MKKINRWLACLVLLFLVQSMYGLEKFEPERGWYLWMLRLDPAEIQTRYPWVFNRATGWNAYDGNNEAKIQALKANGQAVFLDYMPGPIIGGMYEKMAAGERDTELIRMADFIVQEKWPIFLSLEREVQGHLRTWFYGPDLVWGTADDRDPGIYVQAYRRMWQIFEERGANKYVAWCWLISPNYPDDYTRAFYPGDAYVNWVGFDGGSWRSRIAFEQHMEEGYAVKSYEWFVSHFPDKPIFMSEQKAHKDPKMGDDLAVIKYWENVFRLYNERYSRIKSLYIWERKYTAFGEVLDCEFDTPAMKDFMRNQVQSDLFLKYLTIQRVLPGSEPLAITANEPTAFRWKSLWGATYKFSLYGADGVTVLNEQTVPEIMQEEVSASVNLASLPETPWYWRVEAFSDANVKYADSGKYPMTILPASMLDQNTGKITPANDLKMRTWYKEAPIGQTFTTGPEPRNLSAIELYCQSDARTEFGGVRNPTITLWDSTNKAIKLAQASIPSFNDSTIKWRKWDFGAVPMEPSRKYYFEITTHDPISGATNYYNQLLTAFNWNVGYPGGNLYYSLYPFSADLRFKTWQGCDNVYDQNTGEITPPDDLKMRTWYKEAPIGQTFTTGPETRNLLAIELYCQSDSLHTEFGGVRNPTITLWDSTNKASKLAQASIPSFNDSTIKWRKWNFGTVPVEPNRQYYFEITTDDPIIGVTNYYNQLLTAFNWYVGYSGGALHYGNHASSADLRFRTLEAVPVEMDPIALNAVQDKEFELRWSEVPDAACYLVQYSQTPDLSGATMTVVEIEPGQFPTNCVYIVDKAILGAGSTWYWRVYALDAHKNCLAVSAIQPYQVNGPIFVEQMDYQYTNGIHKAGSYFLVLDKTNGTFPTHQSTLTVVTGDFTTAASTTNLRGLEIYNVTQNSKQAVLGIRLKIFKGTTVVGESVFKPYYIYNNTAKSWLYFPLDLTVQPNTQYRVEFTLEPNPWNFGEQYIGRYPGGYSSRLYLRTWTRVQQ